MVASTNASPKFYASQLVFLDSDMRDVTLIRDALLKRMSCVCDPAIGEESELLDLAVSELYKALVVLANAKEKLHALERIAQ